jgi:hypothetical protein
MVGVKFDESVSAGKHKCHICKILARLDLQQSILVAQKNLLHFHSRKNVLYHQHVVAGQALGDF